MAGRQYGVVSRSQLLSLGLTGSAIEHALATERLHPLLRSVFAVGRPGVGRKGRMLAAVLACGPGAVVSHGTAAALLGLWERPPSLIDVIAPGQVGRKLNGIRRHHVSKFAPGETGAWETIPCTSPSRTLVDLAGISGERGLRRTVERAATLGILDVAAVDAALSARRRRGSRNLRAILEDWRRWGRLPRLRSPLEARFLALVVAHRLPVPHCNRVVRVGGLEMEVDFLWERERLIVETDGRAFHGHPVAASRDYLRDRELALAGYRVQRITWTQLEQESDETMAALGAILDDLEPRAT